MHEGMSGEREQENREIGKQRKKIHRGKVSERKEKLEKIETRYGA